MKLKVKNKFSFERKQLIKKFDKHRKKLEFLNSFLVWILVLKLLVFNDNYFCYLLLMI